MLFSQKLCEKNTECANKQKSPHTTGRKIHARLKKEMVKLFLSKDGSENVKKTEHVLTETVTNILIYFVEQEIKSNRKVSKIELWDEAHKQKKDGEYKNANTKIVMVYFYL